MPKLTAEQMENRIALALTYRLAIEEGLVCRELYFERDAKSRHNGRACVAGHTTDSHACPYPKDNMLGMFSALTVTKVMALNDSGHFAEALAMLEDLAGMTVPQVNRAH